MHDPGSPGHDVHSPDFHAAPRRSCDHHEPRATGQAATCLDAFPNAQAGTTVATALARRCRQAPSTLESWNAVHEPH